MTPLKFEYDQLTEEFICELDDKTVMIISGGNRGTWAQHFNAQKTTDTVTISKAEYDALVADAERWKHVLSNSKLSDAIWQALPYEIFDNCKHLNTAIDQAIDSAKGK